MQFISEDIIDSTIQKYESDKSVYKNLVQQLTEEQPHILAYLFQKDFSLLTQAEHEFMLYLSITIWQSVSEVHTSCPRLPQDLIGKMEERNWETLKDSTAKKFRDRVDPFFEGYSQEDLLAFVEDALVYEEEDQLVSNEGREYLFVALKSLIDAFDKAIRN